jgi:hypothetical protein
MVAEVAGAVGGAVVDGDDLEGAEVLGKDALEALVQILPLVIDWYDDGYLVHSFLG